MVSAKKQLVYGFIFLLKFASSLLNSTKDPGRILAETYADITTARTLVWLEQLELKCPDRYFYNESSAQCESCLLVCENNSTLFNSTSCRTRCTALSGLEELRRPEKEALKLNFQFGAFGNDSMKFNQSFQDWKTEKRAQDSKTESLIYWLKTLTISAFSGLAFLCLFYRANAFCRQKRRDKVEPATELPSYAKIPANDVIAKVKTSGETPPEEQRSSDLDKLKKIPPLGDCELTDEPLDT